MTHTVLHSTSRVSDSVMWDDSQDFPRWSEAAYRRTTSGQRSLEKLVASSRAVTHKRQDTLHSTCKVTCKDVEEFEPFSSIRSVHAAHFHTEQKQRRRPGTWAWRGGVHGVLERGKQQEANRELRWEKIQPGNRTEAPIPVFTKKWPKILSKGSQLRICNMDRILKEEITELREYSESIAYYHKSSKLKKK